MAIEKFGDWNKVRVALSSGPKEIMRASRRALLQEGHFLRGKIVEGITKQAPAGEAFRPLSPYTLAIRKATGFTGTKALIERGDLRRSVAVKETSAGVFVGVHRNAVASSGRRLVNIAEVHEFGSKPIVIRMTDRMRRFLAMAFRRAELPERDRNGTGIIVVQIPARPFIRPVFRKFAPGTKERFEKRLKLLLAGKWGTR